jgi:hypothetical protein
VPVIGNKAVKNGRLGFTSTSSITTVELA